MRDGTTLRYSIVGNSNGPRIALIHSLAMDHTFWNPVVARLEGSAQLLTYDCRGHGVSDKPPGPYSIDLFADDLSDLLDAAGWKKTIVAGASMGGSVALGFAAKYSERLAGLGLFDTRRGTARTRHPVGKNARPKPNRRPPASSVSRKHDGLATRSANSIPKWSMPASPRSWQTMSAPMPRHAGCSAISICAPASKRSQFPRRSQSERRITQLRPRRRMIFTPQSNTRPSRS